MAKNDEKTGRELVVTERVETPAPYVPGTEDWDTAVADTVAGHDLAKGELLDALVGIPFRITRLVFRKGVQNARTPYVDAVCSAECVIAPEHALKRRRVNLENLPFEPGSQVVFNDGSTGIYRQLVAYLAARDYITLPDDMPQGGGYGESATDLPPWEWPGVHAGEFDTDSNGDATFSIDVRLTCPRGLRLSEYANDYNPNGSVTRYIA